MAGFSDFFSGLGSMLGGGAQALGQGAQSVGQGIGNLFQGGANLVGKGMSGLGNMFSGGGGPGGPAGINNQNSGAGIPSGSKYNPYTGASMSMGNNGGGGMFSGGMGKTLLPGIATMFGSQLIGNSKAPQMPSSFNDFMGMMNKGGTPGMQSANNYYTNVLNGNNQDAYDAATHSLDLNYQEQLRQLTGQYKSLRPGTDPASDSTYQRDLALLNDQYTRQRAQVSAQVQQGAAQGAAGLGQQQMGGLQSGIEAQLNQIATQWNMNQQQRQSLRDALLSMGGQMVTGPTQMNLMKQIFGGH